MAKAGQASLGKKRASKRRTIALPVLGAAGASLALSGGASATLPAASQAPHTTGPQMALGEEEISDVSLATFYVFDKENQSKLSDELILARGCGGGGGCRGGGGGCRAGGGGCRAGGGCGCRAGGGCGCRAGGCGCAGRCAGGCRCGRACGCGGVFIGACLGCGGGCGTCWTWIAGRWVWTC
jgi:hypothetical protein